MKTDPADSHGFDNFAFLRLLAAMLVLYSHQHALTGRPEPIFIGIHSFGGLGVMIFFSISGFLVAQSWERDPHAGRFLARRLLRVWPGFAVVILLALLVLGPWVSTLSLADYARHPHAAEYLRNLYFNLRGPIPAEFTGSSFPLAVNGSLWTIPLELKCYLLLTLMGIAGLLQLRRILLAIICCATLVYAGWQLRGELIVQYFHLPHHHQMLIEFGICFFIGVLAHLYWAQLRDRVLWVLLGALCFGVITFMLGRPMLAGLVGVPLVVIMLGKQAWPVIRRFDRFGDLSYGVYLYAFPIQQTIIWSLASRLHWWPRLFLTILCTAVFAYASWHLVERHALKLKPRARRSVEPELGQALPARA